MIRTYSRSGAGTIYIRCGSHPEAGKGERVGRQILERRRQRVHVLRSFIQAATKTLLGEFVGEKRRGCSRVRTNLAGRVG